MKPLMSQVQNQAALEDLLGSSKVRGGNFDLPGSKSTILDKKKSNEPSFNDMLLSALQADSKPKHLNAKPQAPKIPDAAPKIDRPNTKTPAKDPQVKEKQLKAPDLGRSEERQDRIDLASKDFETTAKTAQPSSNSNIKPDSDIDSNQNQANSSDARATLAPLKKQLSNKNSSEALINGNAVIAFISGRLDKLDPEALPSLITDSLLIKQAMSASDIAEFMQTPMTIAELAKMLELDQGLLNKAAMDGLDPTKVVMPKDFINALGIDASRVTAELTMLSQKLPVEGIKSYVARAKTMADKNTLSTPMVPAQDGRESLGIQNQRSTTSSFQSPQTSTGIPSGITSPIEIPINSEISQQMSTNPLERFNDASSNITFNTSQLNTTPTRSNVNSINSTPSKMPKTLSKFVDPGELLLAQSIQTGTSVLIPNEFSTPLNTQNLDATSLRSNEFLTSKLTNYQEIETLPEVGIELDVAVTESAPNADLFNAIGKDFDSTSTIRVDFGGDGINQRSLEEHLIDKGLNTAKQAMELTNNSESQLFDLRQFPKDVPSDQIQSSQFEVSPHQQLLTNELSKDAVAATKDSGFAQQDFSGSQEERSDFGGQMSEFASDVASALARNNLEGKVDGEFFVNSLTDKSATTTKGSIANKILGQAQMMLKEGGGTMRVDMEAPGIGKIDVAINLINNQLDVRIVTASEQARDMITREVSGLRESLMQQGISLRGLEVGKAGESAPRNFAGQGQQQFGNGSQDQRATYNDMKEYVQSFKNSYLPTNRTGVSQTIPTNRWANAVNALANNGRLEIRA